MCFCQNCSLKSNCEQVCEEVESYLKSKRNYKTTYRIKEIGSSVTLETKDALNNRKNNGKQSRNQYHRTWAEVVKVADTKLTVKQRQVFWLYLEGLPLAEIGRRLGISGQAVNYAIFGHPVHGGGIVRKIQKLLVNTC